MGEIDVTQLRPWYGDPPRAVPPDVEGYTLVQHARVDMLQLSIVGVVLVPLWWFVFAGAVQWITGASAMHIHLDLSGVILGVLTALVLVPLVHEAVHGITARLCGARPAYGVGPGYAYTTFRESMTRWPYCSVGLAPLLVLSVAGVACAVVAPQLRGLLVFGCVVNAAGSIGDLWMAWAVMRLPRHSIFFDLADGFAAYIPTQPVSAPVRQFQSPEPD